MAVYIKNGYRYYPVCSWEQNQHKLYNAHDIIFNAIYDAVERGEEPDYSQVERIEHAIDVFNSMVIGGIVYAQWKDAQIIKDYIWAYNARH